MENKHSERVFVLGDQVTQSSVSSIIKAICEINIEDAEKEAQIMGYERAPIHLLLNTYGGSVYDGLGLIATMESSETPIFVTVMGSAMSMGLFILCAGHYRRMHAYSTLMYHQISTVSVDKLEGIKKDLVEANRLEKLCENILMKRTRLTLKELETHKKSKGEWYIDAATAAKYGIVDEIIGGELASSDLKKIKKTFDKPKPKAKPKPKKKAAAAQKNEKGA